MLTRIRIELFEHFNVCGSGWTNVSFDEDRIGMVGLCRTDIEYEVVTVIIRIKGVTLDFEVCQHRRCLQDRECFRVSTDAPIDEFLDDPGYRQNSYISTIRGTTFRMA